MISRCSTKARSCEVIGVAAVGLQGQLGLSGKLPWNPADFPEDAKLLRSLLVDPASTCLVMSKNTYDGGAKHFVAKNQVAFDLFSRDSNPSEVIIKLAQNYKLIIVFGGPRVYNAFLPHYNRFILNKLNYSGPADVYFGLPKDALQGDGIVYTFPNPTEVQFCNTLKQIKADAADVESERTGAGMHSTFAPDPIRFDMSTNQLPEERVRNSFIQGVIAELQAVLGGITCAKTMASKLKLSVWLKNTTEQAQAKAWEHYGRIGPAPLEEGDIGAGYGHNMHEFGLPYKGSSARPVNSGRIEDLREHIRKASLSNTSQFFSCVRKLVNGVKNKEYGRDVVISLWDPTQPRSLNPCLCFFQFMLKKDNTLDLAAFQRSSDCLVAGHWNMSYCVLFTHVLAKIVNAATPKDAPKITPGQLTWNLGNVHYYANQQEAYDEYMGRMDVTTTPYRSFRIIGEDGSTEDMLVDFCAGKWKFELAGTPAGDKLDSELIMN